MVKCSVQVEEVDITVHTPKDGSAVGLCGLFAAKGPLNKVEVFGTSIAKIKWYEFWRWHLIPRWKRECIAAREKFKHYYGEPGVRK